MTVCRFVFPFFRFLLFYEAIVSTHTNRNENLDNRRFIIKSVNDERQVLNRFTT